MRTIRDELVEKLVAKRAYGAGAQATGRRGGATSAAFLLKPRVWTWDRRLFGRLGDDLRGLVHDAHRERREHCASGDQSVKLGHLVSSSVSKRRRFDEVKVANG